MGWSVGRLEMCRRCAVSGLIEQLGPLSWGGLIEQLGPLSWGGLMEQLGPLRWGGLTAPLGPLCWGECHRIAGDDGYTEYVDWVARAPQLGVSTMELLEVWKCRTWIEDRNMVARYRYRYDIVVIRG